ncbi:Fanconi anemia core complex-associated protein 24-like [Dysidea avara]|uniref:Fanconi anemia core complex-associated protein 24-like n=1 Tax=Dysidea avara TaxID=196820 RepID=UPI00332141A3
MSRVRLRMREIMMTPNSQKRATRHQLPAGHVAISDKLRGVPLHQELTKCSVKIVLEGSLGVVDCYTGSDTGIIFLPEAAVVNLTDALLRRLTRLSRSQVKGVVLLEQTPTSGQYMVEVQERLVIELGLTCVPVRSPAHAAKMITTMSTSGDPQQNQFLHKGGGGALDSSLLQAIIHLPNTGKVKATALLEKFGSIQAISNASIQELAEATNHSHAVTLYNFFRT